MLAYAIAVPCYGCFSAQTCAATSVVVLLEFVLLGSVCCYCELLVQVSVQVSVKNFLTALGMVNWDFPPVLLAWSCAV
jgi:hypothetical protein